MDVAKGIRWDDEGDGNEKEGRISLAMHHPATICVGQRSSWLGSRVNTAS